MIITFGTILAVFLAYGCWTDATRLILPNWLSFGLLATGFTQSLMIGLPKPVDSIIGVLGGGLFLGIIAVAYRRYRGFDGIGMGDVKFVAASGAWIG